ncbi:hypothetical protein KKB44_04510 [Candidatus Micrarchaeota archaeon]|nr:hypothetical protein [Candidatus Micrarchaeota archaeon]
MKIESSSKAIILGNLLSMIIALALGYDLILIIWIYWLESLIMGLFAFLKLLVGGLRQSKLLPMSFYLAIFFVLHYGVFHLGYFVFLSTLPWFSVKPVEMPLILYGVWGLVAGHAFSFYENVYKKYKEIPAGINAAKLQFSEPYSRIIPIHIMIICGLIVVFFEFSYDMGLLLAFVGLKTLLDLFFHMRKHKLV